MTISVKICGIDRIESVDVAVENGAAYLGFVFYQPSPRNLSLEKAKQLIYRVPKNVIRVGLFVNPTDAEIEDVLSSADLDMIQLHGHESVERVSEVKDRFGLPVMKAVGISDSSDLIYLDEYSRIADQILVDAKPSRNSVLPGGNGLSFDWRLLADRRWTTPWMLAGGLNPNNLLKAAELTGAKQFDVSSGVEASSGVKDIKLISDFIQVANGEL